MKKLFAAVALLLLLSGCVGTNFSWESARQIKPGMTESEVVALMGDPYQIVSDKEGTKWIWAWANLYSANSRSMAVLMKDGKVAAPPDMPKTVN